jgi:Protein of unknown function (DUF4231)
MSTNPQLEYVEQEIHGDIGFFTGRRNGNRRAAFMFTIVPASLAALATVSIGAAEKLSSRWLPILAMIATAIASVLGAWETLFSNRRLWVANNTTLAGLYELKSDIEFRKADAATPITEDQAAQFYGRLKSIRQEAESALQRARST